MAGKSGWAVKREVVVGFRAVALQITSWEVVSRHKRIDVEPNSDSNSEADEWIHLLQLGGIGAVCARMVVEQCGSGTPKAECRRY